MAVVNITDEHLAVTNKLPPKANIHTKVGSVLIISTLMCFLGATILFIITKDTHLSPAPLMLALVSAVPMVTTWAVYFYLLQSYPIHQVVPLLQISAIWLLLIEILFGGSVTLLGLTGIILIFYGAYVLDSGTFKWQIPTKTLLIVAPSMSTWAIALFLTKKASEMGSAVAVYFWQLVASALIGILLFLFVRRYRQGFVYRLQHQGKKFLGLSLLNETFSEASFLFSVLAVAIAPVAAYVPAMTGVQGLFVILITFLFPQSKRSKITKTQIFATILIAFGVIIIEKG